MHSPGPSQLFYWFLLKFSGSGTKVFHGKRYYIWLWEMLLDAARLPETVSSYWFSSLSNRFRVKQPPPHTGLRVMYTPGPVSYTEDLLVFAGLSWPSGHLWVILHQLSGNRAGRVHDLFKVIWSDTAFCCPSAAFNQAPRALQVSEPAPECRGINMLSSVESSRSNTEVKEGGGGVKQTGYSTTTSEFSHRLGYLSALSYA